MTLIIFNNTCDAQQNQFQKQICIQELFYSAQDAILESHQKEKTI